MPERYSSLGTTSRRMQLTFELSNLELSRDYWSDWPSPIQRILYFAKFRGSRTLAKGLFNALSCCNCREVGLLAQQYFDGFYDRANILFGACSADACETGGISQLLRQVKRNH